MNDEAQAHDLINDYKQLALDLTVQIEDYSKSLPGFRTNPVVGYLN